jgi:hypothetical protein
MASQRGVFASKNRFLSHYQGKNRGKKATSVYSLDNGKNLQNAHSRYVICSMKGKMSPKTHRGGGGKRLDRRIFRVDKAPRQSIA